MRRFRWRTVLSGAVLASLVLVAAVQGAMAATDPNNHLSPRKSLLPPGISAAPVLGDFNADCVVDVNDLTGVLGAFVVYDPAADFNHDQIVNQSDVDMLTAMWGVTCGVRLTGDVNGDGVVNVRDLTRVLGDWGTATPQSDIDQNGLVGDFDLDLVQANWGRTLGRRLIGDHTGNDHVDIADLVYVLGNWQVPSSQLELDLVLAQWGATSGTDLLGDVNGDKLVDDADQTLVIAAWGTSWVQADVNGDGAVNVQDLTIVLAEFGNTAGRELLGDVNGDWLVDGADQASVLVYWGTDHAQADLNDDGTVNVQDLTLLLANFNQTYGQQLVGDINGDCEVGDADQKILLAAWGTDFTQADVNGDGQVNVSDLTLQLGNWGAICP